jgi:hypothetical protein
VKRRKVNWVKQGFSISLCSCIRFESWKKSSFNCGFRKKIINVVARTAITWWYMENVKSFFSKNKNSTHNDKNSGDSSHQALIYFSSSEFLSSDFRPIVTLQWYSSLLICVSVIFATKTVLWLFWEPGKGLHQSWRL